jgi:ABC-type lipoprotein export system ATPase subunit
MLEIRDLTKRYPDPAGRSSAPVTALDGVSLTLGPGEFVAVQGPSGSGKSTLLWAAGGLAAPSGGSVSFEGQDLYRLSPEARSRWRARHVGFVFQQFHLVPYLSVLDNVLAPLLAWPMADGRRRAADLLERFGLAARAGHVPGQLSAGEQQRAALARALLHRPRLLLCDEPTGNLDPQSAAVVLDSLAEFQRGGGAVLLATHHAGAAALAQRIVHLQAGRIVSESANGS